MSDNVKSDSISGGLCQDGGGESPRYKSVTTLEVFAVPGTVGCRPIQLGVQKKKADNGLVMFSNKNTLVATEVIFPPAGYSTNAQYVIRKGETVYVDARSVTSDWAKNQYELDGQQVIFVPLDRVVAIQRQVKRVVPVESEG